MKKNKIKLISLFLLLVCLSTLMCGCGSNTEDKSKKYIEKDISIKDFQQIFETKKTDDKIAIIGRNKDGRVLEMYSEDKGKNWLNVVFENIDISQYVLSSAVDNNDNLFAISCDINELDNISNYNCAIYKNDGMKYNIDISNDDVKNLFKICYDNDNNLLLVMKDGKVFKYRGSDGKKIKEYKISEENIVGLCVNTKYIFILSDNGVSKYDAESGEKIEKLKKLDEYIVNNTNIYLQDSSIYINNNEGIYEYDLKEESVEKILDKAIDTIGDNSLIKNGFLKIDDKKYIVVYSSNYMDEEHSSNYIYTYSYSNKINNKRKKEVTLYSLHENMTIEELIRIYNNENKKVKIKYEYGISAFESDISEEEAIKKFNTEMLAGKGPDLLIMDKIDSKPYIEKGLLENIKDVVKENKSDLYGFIDSNYSKEDEVYLFPLKYKVPVIIGKKEDIESVDDLDSLRKVVTEKLKDQDQTILQTYTASDLVNLFYYTESKKWIVDKKINKEEIKKFLENIKAVYEVVKTKNKQEDIKVYNDLMEESVKSDGDKYIYSRNQYLGKMINPIYFAGDEPILLDIGNIFSYRDLFFMFTMCNKKDLSYNLLKNNGAYTFEPSEVIALNAKSKNKEVCKNIISDLLKEKYQKIDLESLSVNKNILLNEYNENLKENKLGSIGIGLNDGKVEYIDIEVPSKEELDKFISQIDLITETTNCIDYNVLKSVTKEADEYVSGNITVEQAVSNINKDLSLYLKE